MSCWNKSTKIPLKGLVIKLETLFSNGKKIKLLINGLRKSQWIKKSRKWFGHLENDREQEPRYFNIENA